MNEPVRPDYGGACLSGLVPALLGDRSEPWLPGTVRGARAIVLLLLDGLGWDAVGDLTPTLRTFDGHAITTVVPSSTVSALTSLTTGSTPAEHGLTGIHVRVDGRNVHILRWTTPHPEGPPPPSEVQTRAPFGGRDVPVVTRSSFEGSGFSAAHLRGARFHGWPTTATLVYRVGDLVRAGEPFVYAYYDGVDTIAHAAGTRHPLYAAEVAFADRLVADLLAVLPEDAALVVTADHGQVDLQPEAWVDLAPIGELIAGHAGDARCRYLYARDGAAAELAQEAEQAAGARAWVFAREQFLDEGWLGRRTTLAAERIGDVVLLARDAAFIDPANRGEQLLRSAHGSATAAEMLVPLLAARGRA